MSPKALDTAVGMLHAGFDIRTEPFLGALLRAAKALLLQVSLHGQIPNVSTLSSAFPHPSPFQESTVLIGDIMVIYRMVMYHGTLHAAWRRHGNLL